MIQMDAGSTNIDQARCEGVQGVRTNPPLLPSFFKILGLFLHKKYTIFTIFPGSHPLQISGSAPVDGNFLVVKPFDIKSIPNSLERKLK